MQNIFSSTADTSLFVPIFLFWSLASLAFISVVSCLGCLLYLRVWLPWLNSAPTEAQIAKRYRQLQAQIRETNTLLKRRNIVDQRTSIPLELAQNHLRMARRLAMEGKSKKSQMQALQKGLDQLADSNHWQSWLTGEHSAFKGKSTGRASAPDARSLSLWQSQPRRFAVKTRVFKRAFVYLDNALSDTPPEKLLTFAEANAAAIAWELDNEGDMAEAIVVDVQTQESFPLFAAATP
jgi:hypothetical protein